MQVSTRLDRLDSQAMLKITDVSSLDTEALRSRHIEADLGATGEAGATPFGGDGCDFGMLAARRHA
jgi:hypothetical protein